MTSKASGLSLGLSISCWLRIWSTFVLTLVRRSKRNFRRKRRMVSWLSSLCLLKTGSSLIIKTRISFKWSNRFWRKIRRWLRTSRRFSAMLNMRSFISIFLMMSSSWSRTWCPTFLNWFRPQINSLRIRRLFRRSFRGISTCLRVKSSKASYNAKGFIRRAKLSILITGSKLDQIWIW